MRFGYPDGLAIDCKLKDVFKRVSKAGGSGGNAEEWAMRGIVRSLALWPITNEIRNAKAAKTVVLNCVSASKYQFHTPLQAGWKRQQKYKSVMSYMFGGDFGSELNDAFAAFKTGVAVNDVDLDQLQFFSKMTINANDPRKYFGTYSYDWAQAPKCLRNNVSRPRLSSTAVIDGLPGRGIIVVRIQASNAVCATNTTLSVY